MFNPRKKHFKKRLQSITAGLYDLEFHLSKLRKLKEGIREQYDKVNEQVMLASAQLKNEQDKPEPNKETVESLERIVSSRKEDLDKLTKQMEGLDSEIEGPENPKNVVNQMDAIHTLQEMMKEHIKSL